MDKVNQVVRWDDGVQQDEVDDDKDCQTRDGTASMESVGSRNEEPHGQKDVNKEIGVQLGGLELSKDGQD